MKRFEIYKMKPIETPLRAGLEKRFAPSTYRLLGRNIYLKSRSVAPFQKSEAVVMMHGLLAGCHCRYVEPASAKDINDTKLQTQSIRSVVRGKDEDLLRLSKTNDIICEFGHTGMGSCDMQRIRARDTADSGRHDHSCDLLLDVVGDEEVVDEVPAEIEDCVRYNDRPAVQGKVWYEEPYQMSH